MEELSDFYEANLDDPKAHLLEKMRLKLKKGLQYKISYEQTYLKALAEGKQLDSQS